MTGHNEAHRSTLISYGTEYFPHPMHYGELE